MPRWRVDILRHRAERLGTIEAANEKEAINRLGLAKEQPERPTVVRHDYGAGRDLVLFALSE
jgi:hypothetical protein